MPMPMPSITRSVPAPRPHANRMLAVLSNISGSRSDGAWRSDNPCRGIERNQERKRNRYLSAARADPAVGRTGRPCAIRTRLMPCGCCC